MIGKEKVGVNRSSIAECEREGAEALKEREKRLGKRMLFQKSWLS